MTRRSNPDNPARSRPTQPRSAPSPAPPARDYRRALADANTVDPVRAPQTSMALAAKHAVDPDMYSSHEKGAAAAVHAMDYYGGINRNARDALSFVEATAWPGFPVLSMLAQLPEYRTMHETLADEVVRTWGKIVSTSSDETAADKITQLTQKLERLNVRSLIRTAVIHDQAYGGAHVFPHLKENGVPVPADSPLLMSPTFVKRGCLESFTCVEPMWITPNAYNANDPTKANFYKPASWYMLSTIVSNTRLFTMISRPVGDMLKAAYSFRGVSISQLAMPYVDNWLRTRQSVSDTVKQFSITYLAADMSQMLAPGGAQSLVDRVQLFNATRDNRNVGIADKETEEIVQINTPLSGLDALQAQSQEQMAAVSHIPLVKLTGITPAGLNANSDGEIRVWYDYVAGYQAHNTGPLMEWILDLVQLSEFGEIDPGLAWDWNPLYELTDLELADVREKNSRTDLAYMEAQVISGEAVQQRLAGDPNSGYAGILADQDDLEPAKKLAAEMLAEALNPQPQELINDPDAEAPVEQAQDAQWREGDHPRAANGQFGQGGGASTAKKAKVSPSEKNAVSSYSGDTFLALNAQLRSGNTSDPLVSQLDSAIEKNALPAQTLYRGMTKEAAKQLFEGGNIQAGAVIADPAFLSTTKDPSIAGMRGLGGVVLRIEAADGAKGLDVESLSQNEQEREVLLPRAAKLTVLGVTPPKQAGSPVVVRVAYQ